MLEKNAKIFVAGHRGLVGSAIWNNLQQRGYTNLVGRSHKELDLLDGTAVKKFFDEERPEAVVLAAAHVGGIMANLQYRADFIYQNLQIQQNVIGESFRHGVKKLLFLGSTCIYPREAPQPMKEEVLLTSPLGYTNEPYAYQPIWTERQLPPGKQPCTACHDPQDLPCQMPQRRGLGCCTQRYQPASGERGKRQLWQRGDSGRACQLRNNPGSGHLVGNRQTVA